MADMMLDATVFLDYRAGHQGARAIVEQIVEGARTASVSPLTLFELWREGLDRRTEIGYAGMLDFMEIAPLSPEAAKVAGVWIASVESESRAELCRQPSSRRRPASAASPSAPATPRSSPSSTRRSSATETSQPLKESEREL